MESLLIHLFDYQCFECNPSLQRVIDTVHSRQAVKRLGMDDLEWVAAAGVPEQLNPPKDP